MNKTTFANAARSSAIRSSSMTRTENGATALKSTGSDLLNFFANAAAMRTRSEQEIANLFAKAFAEDALLAVKMAFWLRNVRGGAMERRAFRIVLQWMAANAVEWIEANIALIPEFGRWDDLYELAAYPRAWLVASRLIRDQIRSDVLAAKMNKPVSLCAKWLKSVNTSSAESNHLGKLTAKSIGYDEREYRKMLSALRSRANVVETQMSAGNFSEIDYEKVPSQAMKLYRDAFKKHNPERFVTYNKAVANGEAVIHSAALAPYEILRSAKMSYSGYGWSWNRNENKSECFTLEGWDETLENQWNALPNWIKGENSALVVEDTSGSMFSNEEGTPAVAAAALNIYFAERNKGPYANLGITYSSTARWIDFSGAKTLKEKVERIPAIVENTNLESVFDLILKLAIKNNIAPEDMVKTLIIVSDGQMDSQMEVNLDETFHDAMERKFQAKGYALPEIVYWQVCSREMSMQADRNTPGVKLVSGKSAALFKNIIEGASTDPYTFMLEVLNSDAYSVVRDPRFM